MCVSSFRDSVLPFNPSYVLTATVSIILNSIFSLIICVISAVAIK